MLPVLFVTDFTEDIRNRQNQEPGFENLPGTAILTE